MTTAMTAPKKSAARKAPAAAAYSAIATGPLTLANPLIYMRTPHAATAQIKTLVKAGCLQICNSNTKGYYSYEATLEAPRPGADDHQHCPSRTGQRLSHTGGRVTDMAGEAQEAGMFNALAPHLEIDIQAVADSEAAASALGPAATQMARLQAELAALQAPAPSTPVPTSALTVGMRVVVRATEADLPLTKHKWIGKCGYITRIDLQDAAQAAGVTVTFRGQHGGVAWFDNDAHLAPAPLKQK